MLETVSACRQLIVDIHATCFVCTYYKPCSLFTNSCLLLTRLSLFLPVLEIKDNPWSLVTIIGLKCLTPAILAYGLPSYFYFLLVLDIKCNCWPVITTIGSNDLLQNPCSTQINPYISVYFNTNACQPAYCLQTLPSHTSIPPISWWMPTTASTCSQGGLGANGWHVTYSLIFSLSGTEVVFVFQSSFCM